MLAIDARDTPPTVDALRYRLTPLLADDGRRPRTVVLLDTYELLADSDARIREEIAPQLPADTLLIIAGQQPPSAGWRTDPAWADLIRVINLQNLDPVAHAGILLDLMHLHTELRQFLQAADAVVDTERLQPATPGDRAEWPLGSRPIIALVDRHEGADSAALARHRFAEQPNAWRVVRDGNGTVTGVMCLLAVEDIPPADRATDPAVAAAWRQLARHAPLRPGERATLVRFWMSDQAYQSVSPVQSLITTQLARHYLGTAGLAVTPAPFARPDEWEQVCEYADQRRMPAADFRVGEKDYAVFGHDWRVVPPEAWVARLSAQEIGSQVPDAPAASPALLVLGDAEFAAAVKQALRDVTRPDRLRDNPLLRSRLVADRAGKDASTGERVAALQQIVTDAAALGQTPADRRLARVLYRAYLSPSIEWPLSAFSRPAQGPKVATRSAQVDPYRRLSPGRGPRRRR